MPLASFQGRPLTEDGVYRLVKDINAARDHPLASGQIKTLFKAVWPGLESDLKVALAVDRSQEVEDVHREPADVMMELVESVRRMERRMDMVPLEPSSTDHAVVGFTDELIDAVGHLTAAWRLAGGRHDLLKAAVDQCRKLVSTAKEMGLIRASVDSSTAEALWEARIRGGK